MGTALEAQVWTNLDAYGNATPLRRHLACFLLLLPRTFHGQKLRDTRAEIERQGFDRVPGRGSKKAPLGAPSPFLSFEVSLQALCIRSGARRSQEQGESRMTVLPGARNRNWLGSKFVLLVGWDIYALRVNVE